MADPATVRLLKRLLLVVDRDVVDRFDDASPSEAARALLDDPGPDLDGHDVDAEGDFDAATRWWLDRMRRPASGLRERMTWFWHGHLTSGLDKAGPRQLADQNLLLHRHALGNFRRLLHDITLDPAMLWWLDGDGSDAAAPNENYARELMELFALGRDAGYTEADVHNGARALAGHWVDDDGATRVRFERDLALRHTVDFLGRRVRTAADVVDAVCDHPACGPWIAGKVHEAFHGEPPDGERRRELAALFVESELEIAPLVEAVVTDPRLVDAPDRSRSPLEWFLAAERLLGVELDTWALDELGQFPMNPPNVAGWPGADRWSSAGLVLTRARLAADHAWDTPTLDDADPVSDVLDRAVLPVVAPATRAALDDVAGTLDGRRERSTVLCATVAVSPEFNLT